MTYPGLSGFYLGGKRFSSHRGIQQGSRSVHDDHPSQVLPVLSQLSGPSFQVGKELRGSQEVPLSELTHDLRGCGETVNDWREKIFLSRSESESRKSSVVTDRP